MAASFFFYDLETSGINPRSARIMQFAGQRTSMDLKPIGDPVNVLVKLTPDILPEPDAILLTGITPQQTLAEGITEAEFLKIFYKEVVQPETIFVGFNNIRFDDEFMRFLHYRNFYDAYEWQWKDGCSRWDLLDLIRMTRALRPNGIVWPFAPDGKPANKLGLLTSVNKLSHDNAHDALSDVNATISIAKLIRDKQPDLFKYLLSVRDKKKVASLVEGDEPFIYTSSHYPSKTLHTTAVYKLIRHPNTDASIVFDLRHNPGVFLNMNEDELLKAWEYTRDPDVHRLPLKTLKYNRVPAIAPLGVIKDEVARERIDLSLDTISKHLKILKDNQTEFTAKILKVINKLNDSQTKAQTTLIDDPLSVDERLYDGFVERKDVALMRNVRSSKPEELSDIAVKLSDQRLKALLPLYKARNYPRYLDHDEKFAWEEFCSKKLTGGEKSSRLANYFSKLSELSEGSVSKERQYLLEELLLYGQSIAPLTESDGEAH